MAAGVWVSWHKVSSTHGLLPFCTVSRDQLSKSIRLTLPPITAAQCTLHNRERALSGSQTDLNVGRESCPASARLWSQNEVNNWAKISTCLITLKPGKRLAFRSEVQVLGATKFDTFADGYTKLYC